MKIPVSPRLGTLLGASLLALSPAFAHAQVTTPPAPSAVELSEDIREELDERYPGWTVKAGTGCDAASAGGPLLLTSDFDNDRLPDYGVVITRADGAAQVLAILTRDKNAIIHELGPWTDGARLQVLPPGRKFRPADSHVDDYFSAQTLAAGACGGATTAYLWTGKEFKATQLQVNR
jgi:hypothetical protein